MSDRVFYINGQWLTYSQAHSLGYTTQKPENVKFYTSDLTEVYIRKDVSDNTYYNSSTSEWLDDITDFGVYAFVGSSVMYRINDPIEYTCYSNTVKSNSFTHVIVDEALVPIDSLIDDEGLTTYPCQPYLMVDGVVTSWYDPEKELYWDNTDGKKKWSENPPVIAQGDLQDVFISTNDSQIYLLPQWEESSFPIRLRSYSFDSQESALNKQIDLKDDLTLLDSDVSTAYVELYPDILNTNTTLYVFPAEGAYDYNNKYYPQGYSLFSGDSITVWVDSDEDVTFYKGTKSYIIGKTHDLDYSEIYWCEDAYRTFSDMLSLGYTITPSLELIAVNTSDELSITDTFKVIFNDKHGYYIDKNWYSTVADLNAAGYYLVEKVSITIYGSYSNLFNGSITRNSESFNTDYKGTYYLDEQKTSILTWDGHKWLCEFRTEFDQDITKYVNSLNLLPPTTTGSTGNAKYLVIPITVNGTPISQFNQASIGDTMYLYFATNYTSWISSSSSHSKFILYHWQYI